MSIIPANQLTGDCMKSTNEVIKQGLEELRSAANSCDDLQITVSGGGYEIHYRTLVVKTDVIKDAVDAINAFRLLEKLGCEDF